ncbi:MAG: extracellular solute-binding protein [Deferribacteraceae bacterium]|jgi:spermidine/putrescine transport system substrate-binding protein|nr:extracellular solute-binding protein [Deferribacteraceae bacterium]
MKKVLVVLLLIAVSALFGCNKNKNQVFIYNWSEYMPDEVIAQFEKETGVSVVYSTYDSNELMYSKIKLQGGAGYDLIFPSTYYVSKMSKEGLLLEIDKSKLPNLKNLAPHLLNQPYDTGNKFSLPYLWGVSLLAFNDKYAKVGEITSWADLWKPEFAGYVLLNNDVREVFQMALMRLGYSGNSTNEKEIEEAYNILTTLVPNVRVFNSDSPKQPFINEEVRVGLSWNGEVYNARLANEHIQYVYPKEGAIAWMDCLSIPKGAKNVDNVYKFIDFLMRPEIAAKIAEEFGYSTPNQAALAVMSEEFRNDHLTNPDENDLKNAQFQDDIGEAILIYEKYWEKLKTGN